MKFKILHVSWVLMLCSCAPHKVLTSDPDRTGEILGVELPESCRVVGMVAEFDKAALLMQAKLELSEDAMGVLAARLKLRKAKNAYVPPDFKFDKGAHGDWWHPPDPFAHNDSDIICYVGPVDYQSKAGSIIVNWADGTAYLYNFGARFPAKGLPDGDMP